MEKESSVLRYFTSRLLLRILTTDAYDPDGASFAPTDDAPFLSLAEPQFVGPLRAPSILAVPTESNHDHLTRGIFTVLPAEGFVKEPGEPVYYNEPIQLQDQRGRMLGIVRRAPFTGHLAADGHSGALVFVLERHKTRLQVIGDKFMRNEVRRSMSLQSPQTSEGSDGGSDSAGKNGVVGLSLTRRASLVQVCGGERLRIPGLMRVIKKQYPGGCIMQPKLDDSSRSSRKSIVEETPPYLTCEIVLTTHPPSLLRSESNTSTASTSSTKSTKRVAHVADRTATGEFVGVLHSGILHRRSEHMKLWRKRFFVLTQVALHRFDATDTLQTVRTHKARASIYLKDCRGVRYERFSQPHELEIELNNGKLFSLHAVDALTCAEWASVLTQAIENPHWIHAEQSCLTVWRSDYQFESPQCPVITKVILRPGKPKLLCSTEPESRTITSSPHWNEKLSLGSITANGFVLVRLADGNVFRLTLEDLARSLLQPQWIAVSTSMEVGRIQTLDGDVDDVRDSLGSKAFRRNEDDKARFLVRLKFRADIQLDKRLTPIQYDLEKRIMVSVLSGVVMLAAVAFGYSHSINSVARSFCAFSAIFLVVVVVAVAPIAWQMYLWMRYGQSMEGELHWFMTLMALEVRPHGDEVSDRMSTSSGEDSRSRIESFITTVDEEESEDGAIVIPTKNPLLGLEKSQQQQRTPALSPQAIRAFRLENALDSILGRPLLAFFAIKEFFPTRFLPRDEQGRRVLYVGMNHVNRKGLVSHNVSGFNIIRYFLYLWEFMWSYQDMQEGVGHSQLVLVLDCLHWPYFKWYSIECQLLIQLLNKTNRYYPNRLARVIFVRNQSSLGSYGRLFQKSLDPEVRNIVESRTSLESLQMDTSAPSSDETYLRDFVTNVLAAHANVVIPSFTPRELEQATRFTTTGSLKENEEQSTDSIGTCALVIPASIGTVTWQVIFESEGITIWKSDEPNRESSVKGKTYQSDSRVAQWRGQCVMKTTNVDRLISLLQSTQESEFWVEGTDRIVLLDKLSRQEDICFWSRRVPFMNFSLSGHRGGGKSLDHEQTNAYFHCVIRRILEIKKTPKSNKRTATVMWKTTSAHHFVVDHTATEDEHVRQGVQWRKLEDPLVSACFVIEEKTTSASQNNVILNFWFQSYSPPTTAKQNTAIAKLVAQMIKDFDAVASQDKEIQKS